MFWQECVKSQIEKAIQNESTLEVEFVDNVGEVNFQFAIQTPLISITSTFAGMDFLRDICKCDNKS